MGEKWLEKKIMKVYKVWILFCKKQKRATIGKIKLAYVHLKILTSKQIFIRRWD